MKTNRTEMEEEKRSGLRKKKKRTLCLGKGTRLG